MKRVLFVCLIFVSNLFFSQEVCGTPYSFNAELEKAILENRLTQKGSLNQTYCVNVHFKIVRNTQGEGGFPATDLGKIIERLNAYFNPHNLYFNSIGYEFIDNTQYVDIGWESEAKHLASIKSKGNAINYYIVENLWSTSDGIVTGTALNIPSNAIVIRRDRVLTTTSPHEIGHCLGLYHTFETYFCEERIDGSNCKDCGDKVCDTPADRGNGAENGYVPDETNLMSYYIFTRNRFTLGQSDRMKMSIVNSPILQAVLGTGCKIPSIDGNNVVCNNASESYSINGDVYNVIEISSNLQEVNRNGKIITITPKPNATGAAYIKAIIDGKEITKKIWIGKPQVEYELTELNEYLISYKLVSKVRDASIEEQGITSIVCANPVFVGKGYISPDCVVGKANSSGRDWSVYRETIVSNACGSVKEKIDYVSRAADPCPYHIVSMDLNTFKIEIPCSSNPIRSVNTVNKDVITIQIVNTMGQTVLTTIDTTFSINHLLSGTYYARVIKDGQVVHTQTLIKK